MGGRDRYMLWDDASDWWEDGRDMQWDDASDWWEDGRDMQWDDAGGRWEEQDRLDNSYTYTDPLE